MASRSGGRRSTATIAASSILRSKTKPTTPRRGEAQGAGESRPSGDPHRAEVARSYRPGIFPFRDRHRGRRRGDRHQSVRSARRRSQQGQDPRTDRGVREVRRAAGRDAGLRRWLFRTLHRPTPMPTRCARPAPTAASRAGSWRISAASAPATMSRSSPISPATKPTRRDAALAHRVARPPPCRDLPGIRAALFAFDRPGLQRRPRQRRIPPDHVGRRQGFADPRPSRQLRRGQGGAGARRFRRSPRTRPAGACAFISMASRKLRWRRSAPQSSARCHETRCHENGARDMQIGVIGLGRMGGNISRRLMQNGHEAVVYDRDPKAVAEVASDGATGAAGSAELVAANSRRRAQSGSCCRPARSPKTSSPSWQSCWRRATSSSMAATRSGRTTSAAPKCSRSAASIMSTSAPAAASGDWSAATA